MRSNSTRPTPLINQYDLTGEQLSTKEKAKMRSDLRRESKANAKWDAYAAKNPLAGQNAGYPDSYNWMRTGPVPSLDGKGPIVYNPFSLNPP